MTSYHDYEGAEYEYPPHEEEPLTNEEWLRQKSVEELAVFLAMVQLDEYEEPIDSAYVNTWVLWLKEKHE